MQGTVRFEKARGREKKTRIPVGWPQQTRENNDYDFRAASTVQTGRRNDSIPNPPTIPNQPPPLTLIIPLLDERGNACVHAGQ